MPKLAHHSERRLYLESIFRHWVAVREVYPNLHRVSERAWRSGQPTPRLLRRWIREHGLRTVICLRQPKASDRLVELERRVCAESGVVLEFLQVYSRGIPSVEKLREVHALLQRIEYPVLIHCQGGADRSGLISTLYLHWMEGVPLDQTRQLTFFPHLHIRTGRSGLIDKFFEAYVRHCESDPIPLIDWAEQHMDPVSLKRGFRPTALGVFLHDILLRRE